MIHTSSTFANAVISNDKKVVQDIHLKSKNIAIFQRDIELLSQELQQVEEQEIECRASGTAEEILSTLKDYFSLHLPHATFLFDDISKLLALFEKTTQASSFKLLLATVSTNMCRKFHTDINDLRLLCTYIGPGTQWLPDEVIDQKTLHAGRKDQKLVVDKQQIQQVPTGDMVLLKGALYPDANPILHRSPPIEKRGEKRLLLRIDTNGFLDLFS